MGEVTQEPATQFAPMQSLSSDVIQKLGGVRPMAVASEVVYVFGKWSNGWYPIQLTYSRQPHRTGVVARWQMTVFGFTCLEEPTCSGLVKLLKQLAIDPLAEKRT